MTIKWDKRSVIKAFQEATASQKTNPLQEQLSKIRKVKFPKIGG